MQGIYIHIPFCKQACNYCNFHFSTTLHQLDELINAIIKEIGLRQNYLPNQKINTVYFGGGTPSIISTHYIQQILEEIDKYYDISMLSEITLEANPDDLTSDYLNKLNQTPVNRLSIGIQSFHDIDLQYMNRAHNGTMAYECIKIAQDHGFEQISADLIYGAPTTSDDMWYYNIEQLIQLRIPHISAYALTVEEKTALDYSIKQKKSAPVLPEQAARQFELLNKQLVSAGFEAYEISNYARNGQYAKHNTNYWKNQAYLGLGPSAHSYNGVNQRQWNISNNVRYIKGINETNNYFEVEKLSHYDQLNEYIMISLRTMWGLSLNHFKEMSSTIEFQSLIGKSAVFISTEQLKNDNQHLILTQKGKLFADKIAATLFFTN